MSGCDQTENSARSGGGVSNSGTLTIGNCTLYGNQGSAIYNTGTATVSGCTLRYNDADNGGAIFNTGKRSVNSSTLSDNYATYSGGAIWSSGTATVSGCTLSNNHADPDFGGGAICVDDYLRSKLTLSDSIFSGNTPIAITGKVINGVATPSPEAEITESRI